jgi:hypothetical protein
VGNILSLARIEAGALQPRWQPVDMLGDLHVYIAGHSATVAGEPLRLTRKELALPGPGAAAGSGPDERCSGPSGISPDLSQTATLRERTGRGWSATPAWATAWRPADTSERPGSDR